MRRRLADFDRATALGAPTTATLNAGRGMALEGLGRHEEADAAFARAFGGPGLAEGADRTRLLWTYGFAVGRAAPVEGAAKPSRRSSAATPDIRRPSTAWPCSRWPRIVPRRRSPRFNQAVQARADFVEARRYRAVALARSAPGSGPARTSAGAWSGAGFGRDPVRRRVRRRARGRGDRRPPRRFRQSIDLLRQALDRGVGLDKFAADPDLAAIRGHPEFPRPAAKPVPRWPDETSCMDRFEPTTTGMADDARRSKPPY